MFEKNNKINVGPVDHDELLCNTLDTLIQRPLKAAVPRSFDINYSDSMVIFTLVRFGHQGQSFPR